MTLSTETADLLGKLGVSRDVLSSGDLVVRSPVTGEQLAALKTVSAADAGKTIDAAHEAFKAWRLV
ncbi:MAG TPA: aldehyde dehydrogenase family protein, partial [Mesorhizobium sp.]|nr:aldehyde dehydrogenase family protein [Mesorhizobium sp.]HEV2507112.1 aldehyde dehydrogenase family protein [Mesorhizobium sp.]